jgi:acetylornithine deacetylase
LDGLPTMVAAFTTDIPALTNWGEPLLIGPGSIHVAHTEGEYVEKQQLSDAVDLYCAIAKKLAGEVTTRDLGWTPPNSRDEPHEL